MEMGMEHRLKNLAFDGALSLSIALGHQLDLFNTLAAVGNAENPATIETLAAFAGIKKNYAEMWLNCMASGDIVETTPDGKGYFIAKENLTALTGPAAAGPIFNRMVPVFAEGYKETLTLIKEEKAGENADGQMLKEEAKEFSEEHSHHHGHGHHENVGHEHNHEHQHGHHGEGPESHPDSHKKLWEQKYARDFPLMDQITIALHNEHLIKDFLPLTEMRSKLEAGINVIDIGCGAGFHVCEFARHFPNSKFIGIDIAQSAVDKGNEKAKSLQLENAEFRVISGEEMPSEWTDHFDWAYSFASIHDHQHPEKAISEIKRVVSPTGRYTMVELDKTGNIHEDKKNPISKYMHTMGIMVMLRTRGHTHAHVQHWTNQHAANLLKDAGFGSVKEVDMPFYDFMTLFIAEN